MSGVLALARPDIVALEAYSHASWDPAFDRLHANELPWRAETDRSLAGLNRYPEPHPHALAARLAQLYGVSPDQLLPGRGSDESIDLLLRGFCRAGVDNVVICPPTFGMYAVAARIQGAQIREVPLRREAGFAVDVAAVRAVCDANTRIIFLCSPNNPTGNSTSHEVLRRILDIPALVVVDEAYLEFAGTDSAVALLAAHQNLVVLRTLSKAYGLAGARVGSLIAAREIVTLLAKVIPPYSIAQLTIEAVMATLTAPQIAVQRERIVQVRAERDRVCATLATSPAVRKVWPSDANFLLIDCADPDGVLAATRAAKLLVRDLRSAALPQSLRVSIGTPEQNDRLLRSLS